MWVPMVFMCAGWLVYMAYHNNQVEEGPECQDQDGRRECQENAIVRNQKMAVGE